MVQIAYTDPGQMDRRISILDPGDPEANRNSDGSFPPPSVFLENIGAKIEGKSSREVIKAQQILGETTHLVTILSSPDASSPRRNIRNRMTILFEGRTLQILDFFDPDEKHVELHILCVERNQGI